jgi:NAD-dependent SIR2 family protein deacetylase
VFPDSDTRIREAADAIRDADALLLCAGAGMGVDSGLPDFRGAEGFWGAYPPLAKLGIRFEQIARPEWFAKDPTLAWGFYGHRLNLYRATRPHAGYGILLRWAEAKPAGYFVYTSNVDGHFERTGFDPARIAECHGSLHHLQCNFQCSADIWSADGFTVEVDEATMRAREPLPTCDACGLLARPNVLMFADWKWEPGRADEQQQRLFDWLDRLHDADARLAIVECGAGTAIPSVRYLSEQLTRRHGATLVRINPREPEGPKGTVSLPLGALDALTRIDAVLAAE